MHIRQHVEYDKIIDENLSKSYVCFKKGKLFAEYDSRGHYGSFRDALVITSSMIFEDCIVDQIFALQIIFNLASKKISDIECIFDAAYMHNFKHIYEDFRNPNHSCLTFSQKMTRVKKNRDEYIQEQISKLIVTAIMNHDIVCYYLLKNEDAFLTLYSLLSPEEKSFLKEQSHENINEGNFFDRGENSKSFYYQMKNKFQRINLADKPAAGIENIRLGRSR